MICLPFIQYNVGEKNKLSSIVFSPIMERSSLWAPHLFSFAPVFSPHPNKSKYQNHSIFFLSIFSSTKQWVNEFKMLALFAAEFNTTTAPYKQTCNSITKVSNPCSF